MARNRAYSPAKITGAASFALLLLVCSCGGPASDITVHIPHYSPNAAASPLAVARPTAVTVSTFTEESGTGALPGRIGERKTLGDISLGLVTIDPPPGQLIEDAYTAELRAAGHSVIAGDAPARLQGQVRRFRLRTDVTALYWDVAVDADIAVTLNKDAMSTTRQYAAHCSERTYAWPGQEVIARVVDSCVNDLAHQFRNDAAIARILSNP